MGKGCAFAETDWETINVREQQEDREPSGNF